MNKEDFVSKASVSYNFQENGFWPVWQYLTTIMKPVCR